MTDKDIFFMNQAFRQALIGQKKGEVPVGAVAVLGEKIVSRGYHSMIGESDSTAHAEIVVLRRAGRQIKNYRLNDLVVYVTLEPCLMCFSALALARIRRLVYAAGDEKTGIFSTGAFKMVKHIFNHGIIVDSGILQEQSSTLLKKFFQDRRDAGAVERGGL